MIERGSGHTFPAKAFIEPRRNPNMEDFGRLEGVIEAELREHRVPGGAVSLLRKDAAFFVKSFGTTDPVTGSVVTPGTMFQIGSVSKLLTAVVALILVEEGRIDLHAPIALHAAHLDASLAGLTMHQLLTHTAGLKDAGPLYGARKNVTLSEALAHWGPQFSFAPPGEVFSYSNPGYSLAGLVIECVTKQSFADAMRERLFVALGMHGSGVGFGPIDSSFSAGHVIVRRPPGTIVVPRADNAEYRPAGYIFSTANDLGRLVMAILNDGVFENNQVLPPTVLQQLATMHVTLPGASDRGYGYGLYVGHSNNGHVASHTGFNAGFGARICLCIDSRQALIVLTNQQAQTLPRTTGAAMEKLCASRRAPPCALPRCTPAAVTPVSDYAGTYAQGHVPLTVRTDAGALWLCCGDTEVALSHAGRDRFVYSISEYPSPIEVVFTNRQPGGFRYLCTRSHAFRSRDTRIVLPA